MSNAGFTRASLRVLPGGEPSSIEGRAECPHYTAWRINRVRADTDSSYVIGLVATGRTSMMRLLELRVPLTLILDLVAPPDARELYAREGVSPDWVPLQALSAID